MARLAVSVYTLLMMTSNALAQEGACDNSDEAALLQRQATIEDASSEEQLSTWVGRRQGKGGKAFSDCVDCVKASDGYEWLGGGWCEDYKYLPEGGYPDLLEDGSPLFSADRTRECMNRCLSAHDSDDKYSDTAFYLDPDKKCACSTGHCQKRKDIEKPKWGDSYRIVHGAASAQLCDPNCKICSALGECQECAGEDLYLLAADHSCVEDCPPGYYKKSKNARNTCMACNGNTRRRVVGSAQQECTSCPPGEVSKSDSDQCVSIQDTCTPDQCAPCAECMQGLVPLWEQCVREKESAAKCVHPGTHWCSGVMHRIAQCKGMSFGCYYKLSCHNPCICPEWKSVFCGGRTTDGICDAKTLLELHASGGQNASQLANNLHDPEASAASLLQRAHVSATSASTSNLDSSVQDKCAG